MNAATTSFRNVLLKQALSFALAAAMWGEVPNVVPSNGYIFKVLTSQGANAEHGHNISSADVFHGQHNLSPQITDWSSCLPCH